MSKSIFKKIRGFLLDDSGPTAVEYAVMLAMILLAVIGTVQLLGTRASASFEESNTKMINAATGG